MWIKFSILVAGALIVLAACSTESGGRSGGGMPQPVDSADKAAANALNAFQKLVTRENYKSLGFDSVDQVQRAMLAAPMPLFNIDLDQLKTYQPGQDVNSVLTPSTEIIYPVTVDGQTKSSVTVAKKPSGYVPASFGNAETVTALARYRGGNTADTFAVRVPVLSMYFLATRTPNGLTLTPVLEYPDLPFRVGVAVPAEQVIQALVPLVQNYNGLPI